MVVCGQVSFLLSSPQYWSAGPGDMLEMDKERSSSMWVRGARMGGTLREAEVLLPAHNMARRWQEMKVARLGYSSGILDVQRAWCSLDFKQEGTRCNFCFRRFCTFLDPGLKATTAAPAQLTLSPDLPAGLGFISLEALVTRVPSVCFIYLPTICLFN